MSQENVDRLRAIYAAWERGDFRSVDWADPGIEWVVAEGPAAGTWRGIAGMAEGWNENLSAWADMRAEPEEFRALEDGRVLVFFHLRARGKASGVEIGEAMSRGAQLVTLHDGKVTRMITYWNRDRALEAAGLRE